MNSITKKQKQDIINPENLNFFNLLSDDTFNDIMEYLKEEFCVLRFVCKDWKARIAPVIQTKVLKYYATTGNIKMITWFKERNMFTIDCGYKELGNQAATHGQQDVIQWIIKQSSSNPDRNWNTDLCYQASSGGHPNLLLWLMKNKYKYDFSSCVHIAIENGVEIFNNKFTNLAFCDDMAMLSRNAVEMQSMINKVAKFNKSNGLKLYYGIDSSKSKTAITHNVDSIHNFTILQENKLHDIPYLNKNESYKYLGIWVNLNLCWKEHSERMLVSITKHINHLP